MDKFNSKPQERIYCILNDICKVQVCPMTKEKLRFNPQTKSYSNSVKFAHSNKIIVNKADHKLRNALYMDNVIKLFTSNHYTLLSDIECI